MLQRPFRLRRLMIQLPLPARFHIFSFLRLFDAIISQLYRDAERERWIAAQR
jgi:hypothetical protein